MAGGLAGDRRLVARAAATGPAPRARDDPPAGRGGASEDHAERLATPRRAFRPRQTASRSVANRRRRPDAVDRTRTAPHPAHARALAPRARAAARALARRPPPLPRPARPRGPSSRGWPTTSGGRPTPSTWTGRCSSSCSWAAPASASRRSSTPSPGGPWPSRRSPGPTTRDPVVYFHQSVRPDRLDPALRLCRLAQHDREALAQKVIVDTPDLDSNDLANRDKLMALLPVADVVLYVGSQEKYHDQLGWELFKEQRQRRAFAFVLNKWDRCVHAGDTGLRPDEDLLRDLKGEGFENPRLFRTTAQLWVDAEAAGEGGPPADRPPGRAVRRAAPLARARADAAGDRGGQGPRRRPVARAGRGGGRRAAAAGPGRRGGEGSRRLGARAAATRPRAQADVLVGTLEPYQTEVEHHFSVEGQQRFRGLMAAYLRLTTKLRYAGSSLRDRIPLGRRCSGGKVETPARVEPRGVRPRVRPRRRRAGARPARRRPWSTACSWRPTSGASRSPC